MGNLLDDLLETTESFEELPFRDVDSLILSQLSYLVFEGLVPGPGGGCTPLGELTGQAALQSMTQGGRVPELNIQLMERIAKNPRFADLKLCGYVNRVDKEAQEQFSAVTFLLKDCAYIAFRGTDSSYIAWKEDFNLAFICPVPAQTSGAAYINEMASLTELPLRVGGHSKGGNVAVYAAAFCEKSVQDRILAVYSHDGPGFTPGVLESAEYAGIQDRIRKTIPRSSLVGVLLQHQENYQVVESDSFWIMQHDPYSWVVEQGDFRRLESLSAQALFLDKSLNAWISSLSKEELSDFADALYQVLCALPGETFSDIPDNWWLAALETLGGLKTLKPDTYVCIFKTVRSLFTLALKNLPRPALHFTPPEEAMPSLLKLRELSLPEGFLQRLPFGKDQT